MAFGKFVMRRVAMTVISFALLTLALFIFWRHYPDEILLMPFINPHSEVPLSIQIESASKTLWLAQPVYLQYFGFLINIFTAKWGYYDLFIGSGSVHTLISFTLNSTIFLIFSSFAAGYILFRIFGHFLKLKKSLIINRIFTGIIIVIIFIAVTYIMQILGNAVLYPRQPPDTAIFIPMPPKFFVSGGYFVSLPTHVFIIDSLIHGEFGAFKIFLPYFIPPFISVSITIAISLLLIERNVLAKIASEESNIPNTKSNYNEYPELKKYINWRVRKGIFENSTVLALVVTLSAIFSNYSALDLYYRGLGNDYYWIFNQFPGVNIASLAVWAFVYITLVIGIIIILLALAGSIISGAMGQEYKHGKELQAGETKIDASKSKG